MSELDLFAGVAAKEEALERHERRHADVLEQMRQHLVTLARDGRQVSADDGRDWLKRQDPMLVREIGKRKDWMGSLFRGKEWEAVGWVVSRHPENHARPIRVWRLKRFT